MREQEYLIALNMVKGLGSIKSLALLNYFSAPSRIFEAKLNKLCAVNGISLFLARSIHSIIHSKEFEEELKAIRRLRPHIVTYIDKSYPECLKQIYDPPLVLYVLGDVGCLKKTAVAVVGCRRASFYGLQQAERIAGQLAGCGICVVSGFARGIDTSAHKGALACGGKTSAVLGSGLNYIYPRENKELFKGIVRQGAVISEFPVDTPPLKGNFPRRNRIISGLSKAVVVVEAARRSGSLITANLALEQGRDVYAVPGAANSVNAQGTNALIKEGAKLVENALDILEELNLTPDIQRRSSDRDLPEETNRSLPIDNQAKKLLGFLSCEPLHIDLLVKFSKLSPTCVYRSLLDLQLKGLVKEIEGKRFVKKEG